MVTIELKQLHPDQYLLDDSGERIVILQKLGMPLDKLVDEANKMNPGRVKPFYPVTLELFLHMAERQRKWKRGEEWDDRQTWKPINM